MNKNIITTNELLKNEKSNIVIAGFMIFAIVGTGISVNSFVSMITNFCTNTIITFVVVTVLFGIPFGYLLGIKQVVYALRKKNLIKKCDVTILIDEIVDKSSTVHGRTSDMDDNNCQLTLKQFSQKTNKNVTVTMKEYNSVNVGDQCILFFTKLSKKPFRIYAGNKYQLDAELCGKIISGL